MDRGGDLTLGVRRVAALSRFPDGSYEVAIETSRGTLPGIFQPVEGGRAAVVWVSGALGGFNGPAGGLYPVLARELRGVGVSSLRITYRWPNELEECVLDTLAAASVLKGLGADNLAVVGHSFGGAVAILAGTINPLFRAVVALSSQVYGTQTVEQISPRRLYLLHGLADTRLPARASEDIHERAGDPKEIRLIPGVGHSLAEAEPEVRAQVRSWLLDSLGMPDSPRPPEANRPLIFRPRGGPDGATLTVAAGDLFDAPVDAIVCPANDHLVPDGPIGERLLARLGGSLADDLLHHRRPRPIGSVVALETPAGGHPAQAILQAVIARADNPFQPATEQIIGQAVEAALAAACDRGAASIALPALGTGGAGVAVEQSARGIVGAIERHWAAGSGPAEILLIAPTAGVRDIYGEAAAAFRSVDRSVER